MMDEIRNGYDPHQANAETILGKGDKDSRTLAKIISFRMIYGGSPYAFFMDYKMPNFSLKRWEGICGAFYDKYSGLGKWQNDNYKLVCKQGFLISPTGRKYIFHKHAKDNGSVVYSKPEVCNYMVQGTATGDIVPLAMVVVARRLIKESLYDVKLINQVHDSIILDAPKKDIDKACSLVYNVFNELPKLIQNYFGFEFNVPLTGECAYGDNWGSLTKWEPRIL